MDRSLAWMAAAVLLALGVGGHARAAPPGCAGLHRGIALNQPMNWASIVPGHPDRYLPRPFADPGHALADADLGGLRAAGFDFVRLTVDPGPFLQLQGQDLQALDDLLIDRVRQVQQAGLAVIVDFHPNDQNAIYGPDAFVGRKGEAIPDGHLRTLRRIAGRLDALQSCKVLLEPLNEPPSEAGPRGAAAWRKRLEGQYAAIRQAAPRLTVVLPGGQAGWFQGLVELDPAAFRADPNVIFTFHYYFPFEFTDQSNPTMPWVTYLAKLRYPARQTSVVDSLAESRRRIAAAGLPVDRAGREAVHVAQETLKYWKSDFGRPSIARDFDQVSAWARRNGVPTNRVLLGEFGVTRDFGPYRGAADPDRERWLADVRREAESRGFPWAIWVFRGTGGMGVGEATGGYVIDPVSARALGLRTVKPSAG